MRFAARALFTRCSQPLQSAADCPCPLDALSLPRCARSFWALYDQTGSAWVQQAEKMDRRLLGVEWLPSQVSSGLVEGSRVGSGVRVRVGVRVRASISVTLRLGLRASSGSGSGLGSGSGFGFGFG
eukprot:5703023-Prymnesium_polylepis.1